MIMAAKLDFGLSRRLAEFIVAGSLNLSMLIERLLRAQMSHYGSIRCLGPELESWILSIRKQLEIGRDRIEFVVSRARQFDLGADYPPVDRYNQQLKASVDDPGTLVLH